MDMMAPVGGSPHRSNSVTQLFSKSSPDLDDSSATNSRLDGTPRTSNVSSSYSIPSSGDSQYDTPSEGLRQSLPSVAGSETEIVQRWPKLSRRRMAASSHARFEMIKHIRTVFEEQLSASSELSTTVMTRSDGRTLMDNEDHSRSGNPSLKSNYSRKWRKCNNAPISSDVGILSKIEDELGPLRGKLSELTGKVKALNLIDIDFVGNDRMCVINNSLPTISHEHVFYPFTKQNNNNYCMEHLHHPGCQMHNSMPNPEFQSSRGKINCPVNVYKEGDLNSDERSDEASATLLSEELHEEQLAEKIASEIAINNKNEDLKKFSDDNSPPDNVPRLDLGQLKKHEYIEVKDARDKITIVPIILNKSLEFIDQPPLLSTNTKWNIPQQLELGFTNSIPTYSSTWLRISPIPKANISQSLTIIEREESKSLRGMTSCPEDFYCT